jgi:thiol:disulfide interchange protein DsbC
MIIFEPESVKHTITVFADSACKHCRQIMLDVPALNSAGVRVRFLAYPLSGPYSAEGRKMAHVWCTPDRRTAFTRLMTQQPVAPRSCEPDFVLYHYALAKKLGLSGTPAIIGEDGEIIGGYRTSDQLLAELTRSRLAEEDR